MDPYQNFQLEPIGIFPLLENSIGSWHKTNWTQLDTAGFSLILFPQLDPIGYFQLYSKIKFLITCLTAHCTDNLIVRQIDTDHWTIEQ